MKDEFDIEIETPFDDDLVADDLVTSTADIVGTERVERDKLMKYERLATLVPLVFAYESEIGKKQRQVDMWREEISKICSSLC